MAKTPDATTPRKTLTLTDPRAIRAIAHEARQKVIDELYSGSVLTATEAATICGLSPSAMSYHLRALEKWGIVVRGGPSSDGRERPWRAGARVLKLGGGASGASKRAAAIAFISTFLASLNQAFDTSLQTDPEAKKARLSRARVYLTDEEADALYEKQLEMISRLEAGRTVGNTPADASPRDYYWILVPHTPARGR